MIIDPKNKFIFVKTKKTASTSIEIAVSKIADSGAVITPIKKMDEQRRLELGGHGARNYLPGKNPYIENSPNLSKYAKRGFYNHMTAWDIRRIMGVGYHEYFSFSVVRNPWDRCLSHYYWSIRSKVNPISFKDFLTRTPENVNSNERILFHPVKGSLLVNYVVRYENLKQDLIELQGRLNLENTDLFDLINQSSSKANIRPAKENKYDLYCETTDRLVSMLCNREIQEFGYQRPF